MRIIPKNTKIKANIYKGLTLSDFLLGFVLFAICALIFASNIPYSKVVAVVLLIISAFAFFDLDGIRMYHEILQLFIFLAQSKRFTKDCDKKTKDIKMLMPVVGFTEEGCIDYGDYSARVIEIKSIELRLLNEFMQDQKINSLGAALQMLDEHQFASLVKIDRPVNFDEFSARLFAKIEDSQANSVNETEREAKGSVLKGRLEQIDRLNNVAKQYRAFYYLVVFDKSKAQLNATAENIATALSAAEIPNSFLNTKESAIFLKYCYTRHFDEREIEKLNEDEYVNYITPKKLEFTRFGYKIDDVSASLIALSDYPLVVSNAWGAGLMNIDNTKVVINIKPVPKDKSIKRVDRGFTELSSRENVFKASKILDQQTHLETMEILLQQLQNDNESLFDVTTYITVFSNESSLVRDVKKQVKKLVNNYGFRCSDLFSRQRDAFLSNNITMLDTQKMFCRGIHSSSLAAVFPFVTTSIMEPEGIALGYTDYPLIVDFFKRDEKHVNSNMLVIGKSGSGKSYCTKTLLANLYSDDCRVFALDPEDEYTKLAKKLGGNVIDVGSAKTGRLNPFHVMTMLTDDGSKANSTASYYTYLQFLEAFFKSVLEGISQDTLELLNNYVVKAYESKGINEFSDFEMIATEDYPVFDDLYKIIKHDLEKETNPLTKSHLQKLDIYISKFAAGGRNSNLWNGCSTLSTTDNFTVFNFQTLLANKNNTTANAQMLLVLKYLDNEIIKTRDLNLANGLNVKIVIAIDEAHTFIDPKHPVALDFMKELAKRIRKYNGMLIVITQNIKDFTGSPEIARKASAVINACQYSMILSLAPNDMNDLVELYERSGTINEVEQNDIVNNTRGQAFFISSPINRTNFTITATEEVENLFKET